MRQIAIWKSVDVGLGAAVLLMALARLEKRAGMVQAVPTEGLVGRLSARTLVEATAMAALMLVASRLS